MGLIDYVLGKCYLSLAGIPLRLVPRLLRAACNFGKHKAVPYKKSSRGFVCLPGAVQLNRKPLFKNSPAQFTRFKKMDFAGVNV
jgi:hypothetical protein